MKIEKVTKDEYYLEIAKTVAMKSTCLRRKYGAIIVKNDEIISTGYNGSPRNTINCDKMGCMREVFGAGKGDAYNLCLSVHAEQNAIISAARRDMIGATLYIVGIDATTQLTANPDPCLLCHRIICNAGIVRVVGAAPNQDRVEPLILNITGMTFLARVQIEYWKEHSRQDSPMDVMLARQDAIDAREALINDPTNEDKMKKSFEACHRAQGLK